MYPRSSNARHSHGYYAVVPEISRVHVLARLFAAAAAVAVGDGGNVLYFCSIFFSVRRFRKTSPASAHCLVALIAGMELVVVKIRLNVVCSTFFPRRCRDIP